MRDRLHASHNTDSDVRRANIYINLVDAKDRDTTTKEFERRMAPQLMGIPDARINFASMNGGFNGRDMVVMLAGDDPVLLDQTARKVEKEMQGLKMIRDARIDGDAGRAVATQRRAARFAAFRPQLAVCHLDGTSCP